MSTEMASSKYKTHLTRVLIVDDMAHVRQELRTWLELTGEVQVVGEATNGAEAVAQAEQLRPDVIVMDLEMPVMDGLTATREIKARGWANRVTILSVHADADTVQRARNAGADVFFDKTSRFETLMSVIVAS